MKNIRIFYLKSFLSLIVKFSIYLNRHVFVMYSMSSNRKCPDQTARMRMLTWTFGAPIQHKNVFIRKTCLCKYVENFISKTEKFQKETSDIFHISAQNIDCGYSLEPPQRGGSNEYQQSMVLSKNKKNNIYPCKPQFYYIKVGFKGVKII